MARSLILLFVFSILFSSWLKSQSDDSVNQNLRKKWPYLVVCGTLSTISGTALTPIGAHYLKMGVAQEGIVNVSKVDYRPLGRRLLGSGIPLLAGGLAMLCSGIYFKTVLNKRVKGNLTTGYLDDGSVGLFLRF